MGQITSGSAASVLFPHTVLSYQNAAGGATPPPRRAEGSVIDGAGKLYAHGTTTCLLSDVSQPLKR